jgi:hypothetical protein
VSLPKGYRYFWGCWQWFFHFLLGFLTSALLGFYYTKNSKWASSIGSSTTDVIERIFAGVKIKEQGYNSCLSVLRLSKTYTGKRLETACELALTQFRSPRYRHLKTILDANQDKHYQEAKTTKKKAQEANDVGYVRGAAYYGGQRHD